MPTYEYLCPHGHRFEVFQKMSDEPLAECEQCGAAAERLISGGSGFLFKGEGFYITDYRSEDYKRKASKETGTTSSGEGGTGGSGTSGSSGSGGQSGSADAPSSSSSTPSSGSAAGGGE